MSNPGAHDPEPGHPVASATHRGLPWLGPRTNYQTMMPVSDPPGRVVFGGMIVFAAFMTWQAESLQRIRYWMLFFACFGVAMMVSGILQQRHEARVRREIRRAEGQWAELLREAATARQNGDGFVRLLQRHGYREFFVRHWLAARLQHALSQGGPVVASASSAGSPAQEP